MRPKRFRKKREEKGSALIAALCLIFTAGMLTASVLILSRISTYDIAAHIDLQRSSYLNEGVMNRVQWLLAAEQNLYPDRALGDIDYTEYDHDRYMADGVTHEMDYYGTKVYFSITDARSGLDLSRSAFRSTLQRLGTPIDTETEFIDQLSSIRDKISDYYDTNDEVALDGMEADEYEAENMAPLPRNSSTKVLREEFFYIPGLIDLFPPDRFGRLSIIRLLRAPTGSPTFFTATPLLLKVYCNFEDEEIEEVLRGCEGVENCVVWGEDSNLFGQKIVAAVQGTVSMKTIRQYASAHLPAHLIPNEYRLNVKLCYTQSGKLIRKRYESAE